MLSRCQFHQHFTRVFFVQSALRSFSLVTIWQIKHFRKKNVLVKCWWNWHQEDLSAVYLQTLDTRLHTSKKNSCPQPQSSRNPSKNADNVGTIFTVTYVTNPNLVHFEQIIFTMFVGHQLITPVQSKLYHFLRCIFFIKRFALISHEHCKLSHFYFLRFEKSGF